MLSCQYKIVSKQLIMFRLSFCFFSHDINFYKTMKYKPFPNDVRNWRKSGDIDPGEMAMELKQFALILIKKTKY